MTTAVHAGHQIRDELQPFLAATEDQLRMEEDPLTDVWAALGDSIFSCYNSRFEVDLNRPRDRALATDPKDTWGLRVWRERPPGEAIERSLEQHDAFYVMMREWIEQLIANNGKVLLLDIHSYNHRRAGRYAPPAPGEQNPDIDLGLTTLDNARFGALASTFAEALACESCQGTKLDVRGNVRYPDGGHWPEWVYANYGDDVCTITLEYKKFYMDEWTGHCFMPVLEDLRIGLANAIRAARRELAACL